MLREAPKKSIARYAMEYGVYFGIYLIVKFALTTFSLNNFVANFVSEVLLIGFRLYFIILCGIIKNKTEEMCVSHNCGCSEYFCFSLHRC